MNWVSVNWLILAGFLGLQMLIGYWASRRVASEADFFVAGRRLGLPLITMSLLATWFGAEACLGAAGIIYDKGLSGARADPLGYALCLALLGLFLARRLASGNYLTLADLYRQRFGVRAERLVVLVLVPSSLIWGAAQVRAFGQVLAVTSSLPVDTAIVVSAAVVVVYTFLGGLMGDIMTDVVQGLLLSVGLVALLVVSLLALPMDPLESTHLSAGALSAERLSLLPKGESLWVQVDRWAVPIFGSLIAQEVIARVLAARTPSIARRAALAASGLYLLLGSIPVVLGLLGPALLPGLQQPEQLLPALAQRQFPHILFLLFACSLLAAILSTVDSILLSSAALLSHNLLVPAFKIEREASKLWVGRAVVVCAGGTCLAIALSAEGIYGLVETASALGTAGILVTSIAALYSKRPSESAAVAALVLGAVSTPIAEYVFEMTAPFLTSIFIAGTVYVGMSFVEQLNPSAKLPAPVRGE